MKMARMFKQKSILAILAVFLVSFSAIAQKISYSEPDRDDTKRTNFDIVGKVGQHILVFKNNRNAEDMSVYDTDMKLLRKEDLNPKNERWINVDFVPYPDFTWMIYQFQQKSIVYCMAVRVDENGKRMTEPIELDTTRIGWSADNKIYTTVFSDDKQNIMIFKINSRQQKNFIFTTLLFDEQLQLRNKQQMGVNMEERNDYFTDFLLDNEGGLVFGKYVRRGGGDYITDLTLITKAADESQFTLHDLKTGDRVLDEVKIKIDNTNRRYLFSSLYYKQKRGNIEGLYTVTWDEGSKSIIREHLLPFNNELRSQAKGQDANLKIAFNDYFIKNIIIRKDGGYLQIAESMYSTTRGGNAFNRWDYMGWNNPWSSPFNSYYYSPYYYNSWGSPYNRFGSGYGQATRYHAENIMILSFDDNDSLEWSNVIPKSQFDDQTDGLISHQLLNTGGELHFLFNLYERRTLLLNDQSIGADGKVTRYPTLKNLERGVEFMPRYGKQISSKTMIMPAQYRNYLIFAKIEF
jgi:hypothetical protein